MNMQRWKGLVWAGALLVGGYLVYDVSDFLKRKDALADEIPPETLSGVLDSVKKPEEQKTDVVDYGLIQRVFHEHDWTGKEKPKPVVVQPGEKPAAAPLDPVASLLKVLAIKADSGKPERSVAYVKFVHPKLVPHAEKGDTILQPGERLFAPFQGVLVDSITGEGVVFAFEDGREKETVPPAPYLPLQPGEFGIVMVGPEGAILPQVQTQIEHASDLPPWKPEQLTQIRKNEFQVGTQTLQDLDRDYSRILSRDVSYSTHKDPSTGQSDGIKINRVAPNSIPAQAGLSEGEVLKSINGHKVTSVNDAVAFVKANANTTDTWVAVFEKQGREFTRTYHSPDP